MQNLIKIAKILTALIVLSIIFTVSSKLGAIIFTIVPIMYLTCLFKKGAKFKNYNFIIKSLISLFLVLVSILGIGGIFTEFGLEKSENKQIATTKIEKKDDRTNNPLKPKTTKKEKNNKAIVGDLKVHYINVGQGDSILIQQDSKNMLIDAGPNSAETTVVDYLKSKGVTKLDYVIGTHPHEDHIGGLDKVIDSFEIGQVFMPKVTANTQTFKSVATAINNKGLKITVPKVGDSYDLGNASWNILSPENASYDNLNNYSVVTRLQFGNNSFIFTGDAESISEGEILQKQLDISGDVLKIGHHGSNTSTSDNFLTKVNPKYAVLSVAKENSYGHPHSSIMSKLKSKGIQVYRTDENETIIATSNGKEIKFNCDPGTYNKGVIKTKNNNEKVSKPSSNTRDSNNVKVNSNKNIKKPASKPVPKVIPVPQQESGQTVYITNSGSKYHTAGCRYLKKSRIPINKSNAINQGYTSCSRCGA